MRNKTLAIIIFMILILLSIALRSAELKRGYSFDEAISMDNISKGFSEIIPSLIKNDIHPPLTAILLYLWMRISQNEVFLRCYFILFGIGALLITSLIAYEYLNQNKWFAILVLFLGAVSPLLISLSPFIRNYIDSAFWLLLANYFLLLIVKNKGSRPVWFGYAASCLLSIYTFYFSFMIILSHFMYLLIFKFKEPRIIKNWITSQAAVAILFLPWWPHFISQMSNTHSSRFWQWERIGFKPGGLSLGMYARNISSLFGFDYYFLFYPEGIIYHFKTQYLFLLALLAFFLLFTFLFYTIAWLKKEFKSDIPLVWFLPFLSLLPVMISWLTNKFTKISVNALYLGAPHAIFLILLAYAIYALIVKHKKIGLSFLFLLIFLYGLRIPIAATSPYAGEKIFKYLKENAKGGDCIIAVDPLPQEKLSIPSYRVDQYLMLREQATSEYYPLPESKAEEFKKTLSQFKRVWFILVYGDAQIFGANRIVYDFLKKCGRKETAVKKFIDSKLILME